MKLNSSIERINVDSKCESFDEFTLTNLFFDADTLETSIYDIQFDLYIAATSAEIYASILDCIKECGGVTPSLERMFGENFSSAASMEAESEVQTKAWYQTFWEKLKIMIEKVIAWFTSFFQSADHIVKKMKDISNRADSFNYPFAIPIYQKDLHWLAIVENLLKYSEIILFTKPIHQGSEADKIMDMFNNEESHFETNYPKLNSFLKDEYKSAEDTISIKSAEDLKLICNICCDAFGFLSDIKKNFENFKTKFGNKSAFESSIAATQSKYSRNKGLDGIERVYHKGISATMKVSKALVKHCILVIRACERNTVKK